MQVKFGSFITSGNGKLSGHVVSHCRSGQYIKNIGLQSNGATKSQLLIRSRQSTIAKQWQKLTESQRLQWIQYAKSHHLVRKAGSIQVLTGQQMYISCNQNIKLSGLTSLLTPGDGMVDYELVLGTCNVITAGTQVILRWVNPMVANIRFIFFATTGVSKGVSYVSKRYLFVTNFISVGATSVNIGSQYTAVFGSLPPVGSAIWFKCFFIDSLTGLASTPVIVRVIVS